jgi:hypothetical protein
MHPAQSIRGSGFGVRGSGKGRFGSAGRSGKGGFRVQVSGFRRCPTSWGRIGRTGRTGRGRLGCEGVRCSGFGVPERKDWGRGLIWRRRFQVSGGAGRFGGRTGRVGSADGGKCGERGSGFGVPESQNRPLRIESFVFRFRLSFPSSVFRLPSSVLRLPPTFLPIFKRPTNQALSAPHARLRPKRRNPEPGIPNPLFPET